jgi:hypothetical protein
VNVRKVSFPNLAVILFFLISCKDQEEVYPAQPHIEFVNVEFAEETQAQLPSALSITFSITDGDLDFGLSTEQTDFPYQFAYYYLKKDGEQISSDKLERGEVTHTDLIQAEDRSSAPFDTLPDPATSCKYLFYTYSEVPDYQSAHLYADRNENFSNLFFKLLLKQPDGSFVEEDIFEEFCVDFNARILPISDFPKHQEQITGPFKITMASPQKGQITYTIRSSAFKLWESRTMKVVIYVKDRALNTSNIIETPQFLI